jgi:uncharacterized membrane protein
MTAKTEGVAFTHTPHPRTVAHKTGTVAPVKVGDVARTGFNGTVAKALTKGIGSMPFFWLLALLMAAWMLFLGDAVLGDPYPWNLMLLVVGGIFQALAMVAIMVGQDILGKAADKRAEDTFNDAAATLHEAGQIQAHLAEQDKCLTTLVGRLTA